MAGAAQASVAFPTLRSVAFSMTVEAPCCRPDRQPQCNWGSTRGPTTSTCASR